MSDETVWDDDDTQWDDDDDDQQVKEAVDLKEDTPASTSVSIKDEPAPLKPTVTRETLEDIARRNAQNRHDFYRQVDAVEMKALELMMKEINVTAGIASMSGQFDVGGSVDLNKLVAFAPNAELDKRKRPNVHIRLRYPHCSAQVNPSGFVSILGSKSRSELYNAARKVAFLVKRSGANQEARIQNFLINNIVMSCRTPEGRKSDLVEVQLRQLGYQATLDQEIFPCVRVVLEYPKTHSCKVFRTGALIFMGLKSVIDCIESIKHFVHVLQHLPKITAVSSNVYGQYVAKLNDDPQPATQDAHAASLALTNAGMGVGDVEAQQQVLLNRVGLDGTTAGVTEEDDFTLEHLDDV